MFETLDTIRKSGGHNTVYVMWDEVLADTKFLNIMAMNKSLSTINLLNGFQEKAMLTNDDYLEIVNRDSNFYLSYLLENKLSNNLNVYESTVDILFNDNLREIYNNFGCVMKDDSYELMDFLNENFEDVCILTPYENSLSVKKVLRGKNYDNDVQMIMTSDFNRVSKIRNKPDENNPLVITYVKNDEWLDNANFINIYN